LKFNNNQKFLAGILSLVLIGGFGNAFAATNIVSNGSVGCTEWNLEGMYVLQTEFEGGLYDLDMVVATDNTMTGGYPTPTPTLNFINSGVTAVGNNVVITYHYVELPGYEAILTGTIAPDGTMSGTWVDNGGASGTERTGTWKTISGNALLTEVNCVSVAGELVPLNTTALFVSSLSSSMIWMAPAIVGIAGVGVYIRTRKN